jgi:hypothetical protein
MFVHRVKKTTLKQFHYFNLLLLSRKYSLVYNSCILFINSIIDLLRILFKFFFVINLKNISLTLNILSFMLWPIFPLLLIIFLLLNHISLNNFIDIQMNLFKLIRTKEVIKIILVLQNYSIHWFWFFWDLRFIF